MPPRTLVLPLLALALLAGACASTSGPAGRTAADLTNPFLGPELSSWLIGPAARLATADEIKQFLALTDDAKAKAFIDAFWEKRNPRPGRENRIRETFDERSVQADKLFSEAGYRGRRTDRGTVFVLYGQPEKTEFEVSPIPNGPPIEVWTYPTEAPKGLDGRKPNPKYRFVKWGELTKLYIPGQDPRLHPQVTSEPP
jgi:GWxTD domain-containing protein